MSKLWFLNLLGRTIYNDPEPPPRKRDRPMQVICPGFPRSGTESLQVALLKLGYDYTYHGWDILFEQPHRMRAWSRLAEKKWYGPNDGESNITAEDFDALLGHSAAVTDAAASVFAAELIEAYPDAKVILNTRDLDSWHRSAVENVVSAINDSWALYLSCFLNSQGFWSWMVYERLLWPLLFRATDNGEGALGRAVRRNGKWIYREHVAMVKGLVPKERLLEWNVSMGWEPLCKFLDKPVPDEPFPRTHDPAGFSGRLDDYMNQTKTRIIRNVTLLSSGIVAGAALLTWRFAPNQSQSAINALQDAVKMIRK